MRFQFHVKHKLAPKEPTINTGRVYGAFGLEPDQGERVYVDPFSIDVEPGQIIMFSGASGGGKTSCLNQFIEQAKAKNLDSIKLDSKKSVIDSLGDFDKCSAIAGACGLAEAQLFLRYPTELSDGQRYRFKMAKALSEGHKILACDEFLATLDRTTAKVIAYNLRKLVTREKLILAVATTHEDIIEDLSPDFLVYFNGKEAEIVRQQQSGKKKFHFTKICTLQKGQERIGNTSSSGTTADIP